MEQLFLDILNRSVAAGWLVLAVIVLRWLLRKGPRAIRPWLWALVGVRLMFPHFGESPLSLIPSPEIIPQTVLTAQSPRIQSGIAFFNAPVNDYLSSHIYEGVIKPVGYTRSVVHILAVVWAAGIALLMVWWLAGYLRLRRRVAEAVRSGDGAWLCDQIDSPFLLGVFRPRIYLPVGLAGEDREYVLAHERAHIRRKDHWAKLLGLLFLTAYWFHPLMWAAYILLCRDIEMACDERVISEKGYSCKKPYSSALLACSVHRGSFTTLAFGEVGVKERVKNVLRYERPTFWMAVACIAAVAVVCVCFLSDPIKESGYTFPDDYVLFSHGDTAHDIYIPKNELAAMHAKNQPYDYSQGPMAFAAGALLYEHAALDYRPADGSSYGVILYNVSSLTMTCGDETHTYPLHETACMDRDDLYDYFPTLKEQEEWSGKFLTDHSDLTITVRTYWAGSGEFGPSVWTVPRENGGQQWWLYEGGRLYALIRLEDAFPFMANGVLWTYMPNQSTILPVRFDTESGARVFAGPDGLLSLDPRGDEWVEHLEVEQGQTVYWKPPLDEDGKPRANVGLHYYYTCQANTPYQDDETLTIRPAMDYTGLYGGVTYGVSNNWLGAASSQIHFTNLNADPETGELIVNTYTGSGPYLTRETGDGVNSVSGRNGPVAVFDAPAE